MDMAGRLQGAVAIVSGGARGMGASHVRGLVEEGARVVIGDVLAEDGAALAAELGEEHVAFAHLDVTDPGAWDAAVALAEARFGAVTILVNNAGIVDFKPMAQTTTEDFRRVVDVNLTGVFNGMRATVPSMRTAGGGVIINISSTAGMIGYAHESGYVASKWGVRGLTKGAALELAPDRIRVVSVHPGVVATPMTTMVTEESYAQQPMPRMGRPEEVTKMVLFLAADATYSTGSEFVVDGGAVLGPVVPVPMD
jgi:3alpha(or 20beta)-hydroxysteroid dehydrogenase